MRVFRRSLWDEKSAILIWALILALYAVFGVSSYKSFGQSETLNQLMQGLPEYMLAMFGGLPWGTVDGYLNTEIFSFLSLLTALYAALFGASALAKEQDSHTIESLLAQPVRRWSVVLGKFGAMAVGAVLLNLVLVATVVLFLSVFGLEGASAATYPIVALASTLTAVATGALALFVSTLGPDQSKAAAYGTGIVIGLYFVNVIGQISDKAKFLTHVNPFGYYRSASIITSGRIAWGDAAFLVGFTLAFLALAVWWFEKKDLT